MKTVLSHELACREIRDWGCYSDTPPNVLKIYKDRMEKAFNYWLTEATAEDLQEDNIDRFTVGYKLVEYCDKNTKYDLLKYGFHDTEGGMAAAEYVRLRLFGLEATVR